MTLESKVNVIYIIKSSLFASNGNSTYFLMEDIHILHNVCLMTKISDCLYDLGVKGRGNKNYIICGVSCKCGYLPGSHRLTPF